MAADPQYTYATALDRDGVDLTGLSADDVHALIVAASCHVEALTGQLFCPTPETRYWDGNDTRIAYDEALLPIIELDSVAIDFSRVDRQRTAARTSADVLLPTLH